MSLAFQPREGKRISLLGNDLIHKVVSEDSAGAIWVAEYFMGPGFTGPPPHNHNKMIEIYYVLEGEMTVQLDEQMVNAPSGSCIYVSPETVHTFSNPGTQPAKYLLITCPGGFEKYFEELPDVVAKHGYSPPPEVMAQLGQKYDFQPPPAAALSWSDAADEELIANWTECESPLSSCTS